MATIRAYTTIEQSRKLAEILPLESADMCWQYQKDRWVGEPYYKEFPQFEHATDKRDIPCWSLSALLGVLPQTITKYIESERCQKTFHLNLFRSYYHCCSYSFSPSISDDDGNNTLYCVGRDNWTWFTQELKHQEVLAWLEKQGKQKPEPKFRVGDFVKDTNYHEEPIYKICSIDSQCYICVAVDGKNLGDKAVMHFSFDNPYLRLVEQKPLELQQNMLSQEKYEKAVDECIYGEQKPADKVEPKFHEGEWITNGDYTWKIVEEKPLDYILQSQDGNVVDDTISHIDEQFHSFTIQDAKAGDVLAFYSEYKGNKMVQVGIIEKYVGKHGGCSNAFKIYVGVNWDNNLQIGDYMGCSDIRPATKEQRDTLLKAMADAGYVFDFDKKELKKIERKPAEFSIFDYRTWQYIVSDVLTKKDGIGQYLDNGECKKIAKYMQEEWSKRLSIEQKTTELPKGQDYGIDGLYAAIDILTKTLGEVGGYQSDDGILAHKCAISAVKELSNQKQAWSEEDEKMIEAIEALCDDKIRFSEFKDVKEYAYTIKNWLKSLKDRIQPQPKQEWSEEDEKILNSLISSLVRIGATTRTDSTSINYTFSKEIDWLKSLKPQNRWKPSEEEMIALEHAINCYSNISPTNTNEVFILEIMKERLKNLTK